jgi:hypothetical protein
MKCTLLRYAFLFWKKMPLQVPGTSGELGGAVPFRNRQRNEAGGMTGSRFQKREGENA